jgi:hypothetical protein
MAAAPAIFNLAFLGEERLVAFQKMHTDDHLPVLGIVDIALPHNSPALKGLTTAEGVLIVPTNILASTMIATRIIIVSRRVNSYTHRRWEHQFTSIAAILIESAIPSTILWIIALAIQINYMNGKDTYWDPGISLVWCALIVSFALYMEGRQKVYF